MKLLHKFRMFIIKHFVKKEETELNLLIKWGYIANNLCPLKCTYCESKNLGDRNQDYMDGHILIEEECYCEDCGKAAGFWVYGHRMP